MPSIIRTKDYRAFLLELKERIERSRLDAARSVNKELIGLYRDIGERILEKQQALGWGRNVIGSLSNDLLAAFPGAQGFSPQNLWLMRQFVLEYSELPKLQQLVGELPWGHNVLIMQKVKNLDARAFYLRAAAHAGWSRNILLNQIKARAWQRSLKQEKSHNFKRALPSNVASRAADMLKSSYDLGFLGTSRLKDERDLENRLIDRVQRFILELGYGFCFISRQQPLRVGNKEFSVDLLFYHRFLHCLVAIDLKMGAFEPEHAGKMDFYLNVLNDKQRSPTDNPSIGIVLCAEKNNLVVEYSLRSKMNPIGVANYSLTEKLPKALAGKLPTAKQLESALRTEAPERTKRT
jgi:predicted nuclease of restriction endonuclease-like (RecB) superfamily